MDSPHAKSNNNFTDYVSATPNYKTPCPSSHPRVRELYSDLYFAQANKDYAAVKDGLQKLANWVEQSLLLFEKSNSQSSSSPKKVIY